METQKVNVKKKIVALKKASFFQWCLLLVSSWHGSSTVSAVLLLNKIEHRAIIFIILIWSLWRNQGWWFWTGWRKTFFTNWNLAYCSPGNMIRMFYSWVCNGVEGKTKLVRFLNKGIVRLVNPDPDPSAVNLVDFQVCRTGWASLSKIDKCVVPSAKANHF